MKRLQYFSEILYKIDTPQYYLYNKLDLSSEDIDGGHTTALRGGEEVAYQTRKKRKTTNSLYLADRQGLPLAISGNHHDLYKIENSLGELFKTLEMANIPIDGLFVNTDSGFDSKDFRNMCASKGVFANVDFNTRNGELGNDNLLNEELTIRDIALKEPIPGWIVTEQY